jgi:hypothetical protein
MSEDALRNECWLKGVTAVFDHILVGCFKLFRHVGSDEGSGRMMVETTGATII